MTFIFHFIYGMSSFPLTNSYFSIWFKPPTSIWFESTLECIAECECRLCILKSLVPWFSMEWLLVACAASFGLGWLARGSPQCPSVAASPCACTCNCVTTEPAPTLQFLWLPAVLAVVIGAVGASWIILKQGVSSVPEKGNRKGHKGIFGATGKALLLTH